MANDDHERSQSYNNAMLGVGYAGVFALLSYTHDILKVHEKANAGGLLLFSLTVFVVWNIGGMLLGTARRFNKLPAGFPSTRLAFCTWLVVFLLVVGSAAAAGVILFRAYWRMIGAG